MTPQEFKQIRIALKKTQAEMSVFLGMKGKGGRIIRYYEAGGRVIPEWVIKILELYKKIENI